MREIFVRVQDEDALVELGPGEGGYFDDCCGLKDVFPMREAGYPCSCWWCEENWVLEDLVEEGLTGFRSDLLVGSQDFCVQHC